MELFEIAEAIGIEKKYPEEMDAIYASMPKDDKPACDLALIEQLQNDHNIGLGQNYSLPWSQCCDSRLYHCYRFFRTSSMILLRYTSEIFLSEIPSLAE